MSGLEGSKLGRYELRHRIARGGMSEIYLGYDLRVRRRVAVKVLYGSDELFVRRFEREAEAIGTLAHDHILPLYDFGEQRPWYYLVMPYVEGGTLRDYLLKREHLELEEAGSFLEQIATALQFAHDHGVMHRDVKPSNILLRPDGHAYLGDFGLAKALLGKIVTNSGAMVGTPEYMAPEQSNGIYDYRSDIYSLGIILYQMLTGRVPFTADSPVAVSLKHIQVNPRPPGELNSAISPAVEAVILRALAKNPDQRFQHANELAETYWHALGTQQAKEYTQQTSSKQQLPKNQSLIGTPSAVTQILNVAETMPRATRSPRFPLKAPALPRHSRKKQRLLLALFICLVLIPGSILSLVPLWQPHSHTLQIRHHNTTPRPLYQATATIRAEQTQATLAAQSRAQATAGITSAVEAGRVLYADTMTTPDSDWIHDGRQCYFSSAGYHVYSALAHTVAWCYSSEQTFSNALITAQATLLRGDFYGLIFRLSPASKSFYVLELNSQGDYRFVLAQGSNPLNWLTLIDWTHSSAIASGYGHTNTLLVLAKGHHFRFYINKQLIVSSFSDSSYSSGMIGFLTGGDSIGGTEATFSNLWVFQK